MRRCSVAGSTVLSVLRRLEEDLEEERRSGLVGQERSDEGAAAVFRTLLDGDMTVVTPSAAMDRLAGAGTVVVGDFHTLPESKAVLARVLEELASRGRFPLVALDALRVGRGRVPAPRMADWPFGESSWGGAMATVRRLGLDLVGVRGRGDRTLGEVERHRLWSRRLLRAAGATRHRLVVVGEIHAAPSSLPRTLADQGHPGPIVSLLLCPPRLFWRLVDRGVEHPEASAVLLAGGSVVALSPVHPLRRAASFRAWEEGEEELALPPRAPWTPSVMTGGSGPLGAALSIVAGALGTTVAQVGEPTVTGPGDVALLEDILGRLSPEAAAEFLAHIRGSQSWFHPTPPVVVYLARLAMSHVGEELAHAVHAVLSPAAPCEAEDVFWEHVVREAVAFAASTFLVPERRPPSVATLRRLAASAGEGAEMARSLLSFLALCRRGARGGTVPSVPDVDLPILGALAHGVGYGLAATLLRRGPTGESILGLVARARLDAPGGAADLVLRLMQDGQVG